MRLVGRVPERPDSGRPPPEPTAPPRRPKSAEPKAAPKKGPAKVKEEKVVKKEKKEKASASAAGPPPAREARTRKNPPSSGGRAAPKKKVRAKPPPDDPPSEPDYGDGDDDEDASNYTYTYVTDEDYGDEEEGPEEGGREQAESERPTNDPSVALTEERRADPPRRAEAPRCAEAPRRAEAPRPEEPRREERRARPEERGGEGGPWPFGGQGMPREERRREPEDRREDEEDRQSRVSEVSTARTSEIKELQLNSRDKGGGDRNKPSLSQVKIEPFRGSRSHYKEWKRTLEAQRSLYRLEEGELAMLIYLSCQGEPRAILSQLEISEMREPGGLQRVMKLLEESFGARSDERFEANQEAYLAFRRTAGMSISEYISTLKRLRNEYLREDEGTVISDKAFAQRLLSRAALTRRERMDIFFSSGGSYKSAKIENVMRFRCAQVHIDEKRTGHEVAHQKREDVRGKKKQFTYRKSDRSRPYRSSRHQANLAEKDEPNEELEEDPSEGDTDEEDLEQEAYTANPEAEGDGGEAEAWPTEDEEDAESGYGSVGGLAEAYAAGWKAKQQSAAQRKARGYSKPEGKGGRSGKGKSKKGRGSDHRTPDERKRSSKCSSCHQRGHWHGDPECPNVQNGTDPPRATAGGTSSQANYTAEGSSNPSTHRVNWTFMVDRDNGWELLQDYGSNSDSEDSSEDDRALAAAVLAEPRVEQQKEKNKKYRLALKTVLEALAAESEDENLKKKLLKKEYSSARDPEASPR